MEAPFTLELIFCNFSLIHSHHCKYCASVQLKYGLARDHRQGLGRPRDEQNSKWQVSVFSENKAAISRNPAPAFCTQSALQCQCCTILLSPLSEMALPWVSVLSNNCYKDPATNSHLKSWVKERALVLLRVLGIEYGRSSLWALFQQLPEILQSQEIHNWK